MKRFALALPVVAAWVLFCLPALGADVLAAQKSSILPEPVETHWLIALMVVVIPAIRTALSNDTIKLPVVAGKYRALIVALLAGGSTIFDGLMNGFELKTALLSFLTLSLPSIVQEILKVVFGAGGVSGKGGAGFFPTTMLGALMLIALPVGGCGYGKVACTALETAAEICPYVLVKMPDGTVEKVPREAILGVAMQAKAARLSGSNQADAGADQ